MAKADEPGKTEALTRIGGGRWETKDGRFQIEPQSGTWVIVDTTQTNEFGLPLVRGPFPTLTAAKAAIETARDEGPIASPLAERLAKAAKAEPPSDAKGGAKTSRTSVAEPDATHEPEPAEPPEPLWLRSLKPVGRQKAREMIEKLAALGIEDAEAIARAEIAGGEPAVARLAIERRIRDSVRGSRSVDAAVQAAVDAIVSGEDESLGVGWSLVDDRSRPIDRIDVGE